MQISGLKSEKTSIKTEFRGHKGDTLMPYNDSRAQQEERLPLIACQELTQLKNCHNSAKVKVTIFQTLNSLINYLFAMVFPSSFPPSLKEFSPLCCMGSCM